MYSAITRKLHGLTARRGGRALLRVELEKSGAAIREGLRPDSQKAVRVDVDLQPRRTAEANPRQPLTDYHLQFDVPFRL